MFDFDLIVVGAGLAAVFAHRHVEPLQQVGRRVVHRRGEQRGGYASRVRRKPHPPGADESAHEADGAGEDRVHRVREVR